MKKATTEVQVELPFISKPRRIVPPTKEGMKRFKGKKIKAPGIVVWEGPSLLNGVPIVVIANCVDGLSQNRKTGPMVQVYILLQDGPPWVSVTNGDDAAICGDCKLRAQKWGGGGRACYVQVWPYVETVWKTYKRGRYLPIDSLDWDPLEFRDVRVGTYGDPAAVPLEVWKRLLHGAKGWTMYTHLWDQCDQKLRYHAMASVDTPEEYEAAKKMGWRCFRSRFSHEKLDKHEIVCPAAVEADKSVQCVGCQLCDGKRNGKDERRNIVIIAHGGGKGWYAQARNPLSIRNQQSLPVIC